MKAIYKPLILAILFLISLTTGYTQELNKTILLSDTTFAGLKLRNIGPAFTSGRIADIAIHQHDDNVWYVAVGSGGVWKTKNAGVTWEPIFDHQNSYSIGCVSIDPNNPNVIWVGTGENVGGRHVGYGDGIYMSDDGGAHWKNMGLKESHHISKIIIHPEDPNVIWIAVQGPLWSKGGDRGLYKSIDGGTSWEKKLGDDEWVGATDILIDPRDPDKLFAATWQRHRNVAAYMGGGPGTGIYRSADGGDTWKKLTSGLPGSNMGKIGLAISPQQPDVLYAAIELERRTGGIFKSVNGGATWSKQSDRVSGGTGPHYYQELYASPHQFDRIYLVDVYTRVSEDGGKTFRTLKEEYKHVDNHAIAFRTDDPDYLLMGTDGGLYESFDLAENWRFIANLPVTQFYKVALDDAAPFYNIYGGTQDNYTQGGPSRTDNYHGIRNADWSILLGGDGHQPATEPGNPDILYGQSQQGYLRRIDRTTGETVLIRPQGEPEEDYERFNWDAPILVSPHQPTRLYFGSQRVWRSEDRGDSWTPISGDLTRNQQRINLPIMDRAWGWDAPWDLLAMSTYNTITSLAESPLNDGLIYAGTDDGLIQVTENGGQSWRKIEVGSLPGVPATSFVNDIKADLHDENTVYVALDNHKFGDLNPYLLKSTDLGRTWQPITNGIPEKTLVWRIVQDHVEPNLLFAATEFGIYFTIDGGQKWIELKGDMPVISFRDLAIQRRENDLVGASFGRGFFILDDYSVLRHVSEEQLHQEATLFPTRKAWWYFNRPVVGFSTKGSSGAGYFTAPNPPFGAVFTYYLANTLKTKKELRQENEKSLKIDETDIPFPGWEAVEAERREEGPKIWLTVKNESEEVIRRIEGPLVKGFHRVAWDLRYPSQRALDIDQEINASDRSGPMVAPGSYTVALSKEVDGMITDLSGPVSFTVERLHKGALQGSEPSETVAFWREIEKLDGAISAVSISLRNTMKKVDAMQQALYQSGIEPGEHDEQIHTLKQELLDLDEQLNGNRSKREIGEKYQMTVRNRLSVASDGTSRSTYGPTPTNSRSLEIANQQFIEIRNKLEQILDDQIPQLEKLLKDAGAPWIEGQGLPGE